MSAAAPQAFATWLLQGKPDGMDSTPGFGAGQLDRGCFIGNNEEMNMSKRGDQ